MKILQIGCGGIGSILVQEVKECVEQHQIDSMIEYTIVDDDIVELDQISYQNFLPREAGTSKSNALASRIKPLDVKWFNANKRRIVEDKQLKGFDIIILAVDNDVTRKLVVEYCFKNNKEFLDLRATGRNIMAIPRMDELKDNLKFISELYLIL
jgi:molybdopterin/thiamine biosynthesis adenylyltransferase